MPRRTYDRALVRSLLAERERNGWSLEELSRRSGVPISTLGSWSAKHHQMRREATESLGGFTEVVMAGDAGGHKGATIRLSHNNGWTIELPIEAAGSIVTQLVEALTRCS